MDHSVRQAHDRLIVSRENKSRFLNSIHEPHQLEDRRASFLIQVGSWLVRQNDLGSSS